MSQSIYFLYRLPTTILPHVRIERAKTNGFVLFIMSAEPEIAKDAVLKRSERIPEGTPQVQGYDFNQGVDYSKLLESYVHTGFQATNLGLAIKEINKMVSSTACPVN